MNHTEQQRAALERFVNQVEMLDYDNVFAAELLAARTALAAAPTEQDRRAGYIEGLEAAAKICDDFAKEQYCESQTDLNFVAKQIRALIDKEPG